MILRVLAVILAGISMRLISPPISWYPLHWFNLVPVFWAMRPNEDKKNAWLMYLFGASLLVSNYSWISESIIRFSNFPVVLAWACVVGYAFLFATPFWALGYATQWTRQRFGIWWIWILPALQVVLEFLWPSLFPYYHGALFYRSTWSWQWASVFGVTGLSYLIFLSNAAICEFGIYGRKKISINRKHLIGIVLLFVVHNIFGMVRYSNVEQQLSDAPVLRAAILQRDVTMEHRLKRSPWVSIQAWYDLTLEVAKEKPDLVVWPEGAMGGPFNPDDERQYRALGGKSIKDLFSELTSSHDFAFLVGGGTITFHDEANDDGYPNYTAYNSCYLFNRKGEVAGRYDKMVLLPFGEYIPFSDTFPILKRIIRGPGNFQRGSSVTVFKAKGDNFDYSFTSPICYEAILHSQMDKMKDSDLFVNITNDAWFGKTQCPYQHAMLATVQSIQYGRPMLRIGYTGIGMIVEPHGQIRNETEPFVEVATIGEIRMAQIPTIYRYGGWLFPWACILGWIGVIFRGRKIETTEC